MWTVSTYMRSDCEDERGKWKVQTFEKPSQAISCAADEVMYFGVMNVMLARVVGVDIKVTATALEGDSVCGVAEGGLKRMAINKMKARKA